VAGVRLRFRFAGELNDFLKPCRRGEEFEYTAGATDTLKHIIESLGVPHTEVGRVSVDGCAGSLTGDSEGWKLH
jgi:hypothetical protein